MKSPQISIKQSIEQVLIKNNEVLTVYLEIKDKEKRKNIQIEIRILDNKPEIFCDELETKTFKDYIYG